MNCLCATRIGDRVGKAVDMRPRHRPLSFVTLCLLALVGCQGDRGIVGTYEDTEATSSGGEASSGSDTSVGCLDACDPDFAVAHISGPNLFAKKIHLVGSASGTCVGDRCPESFASLTYGGATIEPCTESDDATASPLGAAEYCRLAPVFVSFGLEVGFATAVDRDSFEEKGGGLEPSPDDGYLWHSDVASIEGPSTAYRGVVPPSTAGQPETITGVRNLTCIERLAQENVAWTADTIDARCSATWDDGGTLRPRRMAPISELTPVRGRYTSGGASCDSPEGSDTCCSSCDYELAVSIAKYGVTGSGQRRSPAQDTAIACDPDGDVFVECRDFVPEVDRSRESLHYSYAWDGDVESWPLPRGDKLRETHPDDRPASLEAGGAACAGDDECEPGLACIGASCRVPWTVRCAANAATTGATGYCVDARFDDRSAAACFVANVDFEHGSAGDRLAACDVDGDGMEASECCDAALGGGAACDPLFQEGIAPVPRYDRDATLPAAAHCTCDEASAASDACETTVATWCEAPLGSPDPDVLASAAGEWAARTVGTRGGVRWDEMLGVMDVRIADFGGQPRAAVESCAEGRGLIPVREAADNWNGAFLPERVADHDLALCSGSTYRLVFATADAASHVRSLEGGTLDGRDVHVFETSQFRVVPGSAFPTENLSIGACDDFSVRFSNKYDLSETNLRKLELRDEDGNLTAGGPTCSATATAEEIAAGAVPCLVVDVSDRAIGEVSVSIDDSVHGVVLQVGQRYVLVAPGLASIGSMADAAAYAAAFHDACGMPLVVGDGAEMLALSEAAFVIDAPCE